MKSKRNQKLTTLLKNQFAKGREHHAYLFSGSEAVGKSEAIKELTLFLLCEKNGPCYRCSSCKQIEKRIHPFVLNIEPETAGKSAASTISIKKIQEINRFLSLSIPDRSYRIVVIYKAQFLTREAQNALLKLLEEPTPRSIIFLTVNHPQNLLSTVISRTQLIKFTPTPNLDIVEYLSTLNIKDAQLLAIPVAGKPILLEKLLKNSQENIKQTKKQLALLQKITDIPIYKRIKLGEKLSQDPKSAHYFFKLYKNFLYNQLKRQLDSDFYDQDKIRDFVQKIHLIKNSQSSLEKGTNPKLVLENFLINL